MKDFDLNKIGKKMPYSAPSEEFFENFTEDILSRVKSAPQKTFSLKRVLTPFIGAAAAAAVIITLMFELSYTTPKSQKIAQNSVSAEELVESFFDDLSDDELEYLATENTYYDDFYSNLPNL